MSRSSTGASTASPTANAPEGAEAAGWPGCAGALVAGMTRYRRCWRRRTPARCCTTTCTSCRRCDLHDGQVALVGDAAHAMTPDLGQGAGQALEDAVVLAKTVDGPSGLEAYDRLRGGRAPRRSRCARTGRGGGPMGVPGGGHPAQHRLRMLPGSSFVRSLAPGPGLDRLTSARGRQGRGTRWGAASVAVARVTAPPAALADDHAVAPQLPAVGVAQRLLVAVKIEDRGGDQQPPSRWNSVRASPCAEALAGRASCTE